MLIPDQLVQVQMDPLDPVLLLQHTQTKLLLADFQQVHKLLGPEQRLNRKFIEFCSHKIELDEDSYFCEQFSYLLEIDVAVLKGESDYVLRERAVSELILFEALADQCL